MLFATMVERGRRRCYFTFILMVTLQSCLGIEHNLPDNVELVDPKDLGLNGQIDLDKLLGNVKALPIDTNGISAALGKPGLKTQVLTVGFDGSEGLNLDDFELPQLKNDEHGPLAQAAFSSFKNFLKNNTGSVQYGDNGPVEQIRQVQHIPAPVSSEEVTTAPKPVQRNGGKRRTMMKRRKIIRVNGTTTTPEPPTEPPQPIEIPRNHPLSNAPGPKVIELDSSQIEKLIASGKLGPPKSLTPGGPQVLELGQGDLDALLSSENGDEIKQILESGNVPQDFDISQISGVPSFGNKLNLPQLENFPTTTHVTESNTPEILSSSEPTSPPVTTSSLPSDVTSGSTLPQRETTIVSTTAAPTTQSTTTDHPIIFQYSSSQDSARNNPQNRIPPQGIQGSIPLQFYSSHANGQQQARLVKTPTFELISAPPVSFSSSILPSSSNQVSPVQQHQPQPIFVHPNFNQPQLTQFLPVNPQHQQKPAQQQFPSFQQIPTNSKPQNLKESINKIVPVAQTSSHTEQVQTNSIPNSNIYKVNLPVNSVKLVTPSPQVVHSVLNQVPASFQPSLIPNHVVSSPVLDPLRVGGIPPQQGSNFLRQPIQPQNNLISTEPFRNTQLFGNGPAVIPPTSRPLSPIRSPPSSFRFPTTSGILGSQGGPSRFRTAESSNPFFTFQQQPFGNLILNSFVAGDGLNYSGKSRENYQSPGI